MGGGSGSRPGSQHQRAGTKRHAAFFQLVATHPSHGDRDVESLGQGCGTGHGRTGEDSGSAAPGHPCFALRPGAQWRGGHDDWCALLYPGAFQADGNGGAAHDGRERSGEFAGLLAHLPEVLHGQERARRYQVTGRVGSWFVPVVDRCQGRQPGQAGWHQDPYSRCAGGAYRQAVGAGVDFLNADRSL